MSWQRWGARAERIAAGHTLPPVRAGRQDRIGGRRGAQSARAGQAGRAEVAGRAGGALGNELRPRLRVGLVAGRRGFTLVEVLMVVVIIGLLIGLLLPAINSAVVRARESRVSAEIQNLSAAIADFKAQFGFEPPSSITLYENPNGWNANTAAARESRSVLRRMFAQIQLSNLDGDATPNEVPDDGFDFNHDNDQSDTVTLNGAECLVFFLGGVQTRDDPTNPSSSVQMVGFAKNPRNPFSRTDANRIGPFFSGFNTRLVDAFPATPNGMAEFLDPLPGQARPYLYVNSNDGRGYDTPAANGGTVTPDLAGSGMSDVYRVSPPNTSSTPPNPGAAHNPKSYQIISAGYDTLYGTGGYFDPNNPEPSLIVDPLAYLTGFSAPRQTEAERDNITNFHLRRLAP